jgi:tetratricopeptide (TPR) repeat protein
VLPCVTHNARWVIVAAVLVSSVLWTRPVHGDALTSDEESEQAYAYNRDGLAAMSKARFEEAIDLFDRAARMVPDYQIMNRSLSYTPTFMAAWAYEKIGYNAKACEHFRRFLDTAPSDRIEAGKAAHAREFLSQHCHASGAAAPHPRPAVAETA